MTSTRRLFFQSLLAIAVLVLVAGLLGAWRSWGGALAAVLIATAVSLAVAMRRGSAESRALRQLRDTARALAAGRLGARPALSLPGEPGEVADALRGAAEQLGARIEKLESEDTLLSALLESLNEGVLALDARARIVRVNRAGRELLGLGDAALPLPADRLPRAFPLHQALQRALEGSATGPVEIVAGGRTLVVTTHPLGAGAGGAPGESAGGGAAAALFDLTQLRRLEQIRRDFVANVSHELRTPLTVVSGFAEALDDAELSAGQRHRFTSAIRAHTARMQRLVDDLLDLSRIESGGWVPTPEPVDFAALAADAVAAVEADARAEGVAVRVDVEPSLGPLRVDRTALRQILSNLLENSVKHTARGEIVVFGRPDRDGIRIGVRDTGTGIPPAHLPRIFERFYRADPARSRESGGTGLGLAIVKHLVEAHGGTVSAESEVGRGTTISALLPVRAVGDQS